MPSILVLRLTGGASNSDPDLSLGGVSSSNEVSATPLNNVFDNVSPSEASGGAVEYRALDIFNSGDAAATSVSVFMSTETPNANTSLDIGIVTSPINDTESVANELAAPVGAGIAFAHYNSASKLSLPDIPAGSYCRVWLKRTVTAGAINASSDLGTLTWEFA